MTRRAIILDANILIRAVLGQRVRRLILDDVTFFAPDSAFDEAREYLPGLLEKRGVSGAAALAMLDALENVVRPIDAELYQPLERSALARIGACTVWAKLPNEQSGLVGANWRTAFSVCRSMSRGSASVTRGERLARRLVHRGHRAAPLTPAPRNRDREAETVRAMAYTYRVTDRRFADELYAAAERHERAADIGHGLETRRATADR
jgi:hypothetical protein